MLVVEQGVHPHPGPTIYDCGFDDSDGGEWAGDGDDSADYADDEGWAVEPLMPDHGPFPDDHEDLGEMAWNMLMHPPASGKGVPRTSTNMTPDHGQQVWSDPDAKAMEELQQTELTAMRAEDLQTNVVREDGADPDDSDDDASPPLAGDSSDDELPEETGGVEHVDESEPYVDTDEELGYDDWYDARRGWCRGKVEGVLGSEPPFDPVAWAISTSSCSMDVDSSVRKLIRNTSEEDNNFQKPGRPG